MSEPREKPVAANRQERIDDAADLLVELRDALDEAERKLGAAEHDAAFYKQALGNARGALYELADRIEGALDDDGAAEWVKFAREAAQS